MAAFRYSGRLLQMMRKVLVALVLLPTLAFGSAGCGESGSEGRFSAKANAKPFGGPTPLRVAFTATARNTSGDTTYRWRFDDGTTSNEQNPTHTFTKPGYYQVSVDVKDEKHDLERQNLLLGAWPPKVWSQAFARQRPPTPKEARQMVRQQWERTYERRRQQRQEARRKRGEA